MPRSAHKRSALQAVATQDFFDPAIDSVPLMNEELQTIAELVEQTRLYSAAMSARLAQGETMDMQKPAWMEEFEEFQRTMGEKRRENGGDGGYGGEAYASCGDCGVRMPVGRMVDEEQKAEESLDCEEEQAQQAGGLRYRPHGWQVEQRYKAYEMLMKGFELDEATGFKRPGLRPGAEGFYNSRLLVPSPFTDIPHNLLQKYLRISHLQDLPTRLALASSVIDQSNLRSYLLQQSELDNEGAKFLTRYFIKDEITANRFSLDSPGPVSEVEPMRLLQNPPLDFTNAGDITVYLPCAVRKEQWDELRLVKYEADLCVLELYDFGINCEEGKHLKDAPTPEIVDAIMQVPGESWMAGQIYADRITAACRLACCTEFLDEAPGENGEESESEGCKGDAVRASHLQTWNQIERVERQDGVTAATVPNVMEQELESTPAKQVGKPPQGRLVRRTKATPLQDGREGPQVREEGADPPLAPRKQVVAKRVKEQDVVTSATEVIDEKELELRLERKVGKKLPKQVFPLEAGDKAASVRNLNVKTFRPGTDKAPATTTVDDQLFSQTVPVGTEGVKATRDTLRRGYLQGKWELVEESGNADTRATNKGDQSGRGDDFWPTVESVSFDPLQAYEDLRLELCARRYKRALIAQQVRVLEERGHSGQSHVGETGAAAVEALDEKGQRRMRELEWKLQQDFPVVAEIVRWRVAWERDEIEV